MEVEYFSKDYLNFFKVLAINKDWFDENRKRYEISVKNPFKKITERLIAEVEAIDSEQRELKQNIAFSEFTETLDSVKIKRPTS